MKTKRLNILILPLVVILMLSSCKKYQDGPWFTLITKKARVANTWELSEAFVGNTNVKSDFEKYELDLSKEGDARLLANYALYEVSYDFNTSGRWELRNNDEDIHFNYGDDMADNTFRILMLKEGEMRLLDIENGLELHFLPK
jgi:hypothetical protein